MIYCTKYRVQFALIVTSLDTVYLIYDAVCGFFFHVFSLNVRTASFLCLRGRPAPGDVVVWCSFTSPSPRCRRRALEIYRETLGYIFSYRSICCPPAPLSLSLSLFLSLSLSFLGIYSGPLLSFHPLSLSPILPPSSFALSLFLRSFFLPLHPSLTLCLFFRASPFCRWCEKSKFVVAKRNIDRRYTRKCS